MVDESDVKKPLLPRTLPRWWRVLPPLVLIMIIATIDSLILNDFIEYRYTNYYELNSSSTQNKHELCINASRISHNSTPSISTTTSKYPISTTKSSNEIIQESAARLNVFLSLAATVPAILTSIFLGANCDRIGRKPLIAFPFIGKSMRYFILTAVAYYNLPDIWIILSTVFDGLFGTAGLSIISSFAYVTDCTNEKLRTSSIIITEVCIGCSRFLPLITMGIYLQHPRYVQSIMFTLLLSLSGLVFCIFLQPESNLNVQHLNIFQQLKKSEFRAITKGFQVFFVKRQEHKQRSLLILVTIHLLLIFMICGHISMYYLYLYGVPFCFDSFSVSVNSSVQTAATILLTIPFALFIAKRTDHLVLPGLGCLAFMTQLVLFGVARQNWILYLAVGIGGMFYVLTPIIRSRITKLVESDEYAAVFILATIVETGGYYAISALTNEIYQVSLTFDQGLVFFCIALIGAIAIILMSILHVLEYRPSEMKKASSLNE
ncbi:unnamed protein product [Rotaria sp. Silwood2]|nr:unnamed protein product [Rotaria sp. Silwood2]CAF2488035.1 unnamed protein product [Rotaria sp. Silwood2]CAF2744673.1 unnamed protein product [Rotaria sp. Silwood2]CAF2887744.1 unnamed protein product [Rotaria sp. Silwood2]CAF3863514.1 unnamed protein product [Rotaria sp. Silwood2]